MKADISYLDLARAAVERNNFPLFWKLFKQHARVVRKQRKKATATVAR